MGDTVDDRNPALPIIRAYTIFPIVKGTQGNAGSISSTVGVWAEGFSKGLRV